MILSLTVDISKPSGRRQAAQLLREAAEMRDDDPEREGHFWDGVNGVRATYNLLKGSQPHEPFPYTLVDAVRREHGYEFLLGKTILRCAPTRDAVLRLAARLDSR